jgi:hypothetical protein
MRSGPWVREYTLGVGIRGANNRAFYSLSLPAHLLVVVGIGGAPKGPCPSGTWDVFLDIYYLLHFFHSKIVFSSSPKHAMSSEHKHRAPSQL